MAGKERSKSTIWCAPRLGYLAERLDNRDGKERDVTALIDRLTGFAFPSATGTWTAPWEW